MLRFLLMGDRACFRALLIVGLPELDERNSDQSPNFA